MKRRSESGTRYIDVDHSENQLLQVSKQQQTCFCDLYQLMGLINLKCDSLNSRAIEICRKFLIATLGYQKLETLDFADENFQIAIKFCIFNEYKSPR